MKTVKSKEELKKALDAGEKDFVITDDKLLKALGVTYWIQKNKVKGAALLAAIGVGTAAATVATGGAAGPAIMCLSAVSSTVGAGLTVGGVTITAVEIVAVAFTIRLLMTYNQKVKRIDMKESRVEFE